MKSFREYFGQADTFAQMAASSAEYSALWMAQRERAVVPPDLLARAVGLDGAWHLLVISEDWCIDSQSLVPVVSALADAAPTIDLRIVSRDAEPALMDAHLSNGTARSIPVVIVLDTNYQERGWWGSRPHALQERIAAAWMSLEKGDRNKEIRRWYAMDKGRSTLEEIVALLERSAADQPQRAIAGA